MRVTVAVRSLCTLPILRMIAILVVDVAMLKLFRMRVVMFVQMRVAPTAASAFVRVVVVVVTLPTALVLVVVVVVVVVIILGNDPPRAAALLAHNAVVIHWREDEIAVPLKLDLIRRDQPRAHHLIAIHE